MLQTNSLLNLISSYLEYYLRTRTLLQYSWNFVGSVRLHTLKLLRLGLGKLRRETGESVLIAVDYGLACFILAAPMMT